MSLKWIRGEFTGLTPDEVGGVFNGMLGQPGSMTFWMIVTVIIGFPRMQPRPAEGCGTRNQIHDGIPVCYPDHPLYQKRYPARRSRRRALLPDT